MLFLKFIGKQKFLGQINLIISAHGVHIGNGGFSGNHTLPVWPVFWSISFRNIGFLNFIGSAFQKSRDGNLFFCLQGHNTVNCFSAFGFSCSGFQRIVSAIGYSVQLNGKGKLLLMVNGYSLRNLNGFG